MSNLLAAYSSPQSRHSRSVSEDQVVRSGAVSTTICFLRVRWSLSLFAQTRDTRVTRACASGEQVSTSRRGEHLTPQSSSCNSKNAELMTGGAPGTQLSNSKFRVGPNLKFRARGSRSGLRSCAAGKLNSGDHASPVLGTNPDCFI